MQTVIDYAIHAGEWIIARTLVPYPGISTAVLAVAALAMWVIGAYKLARISKSWERMR